MLVRMLVLLLFAVPAWSLNAVSEEMIHRAVHDFVESELEGRLDAAERIEINVRWQGNILLETSGKIEMIVRRHSGRPFRGPTIVRLDIRVDGNTQRELVLTVDTHYLRPVLISTHGIRRHEAFDSTLVIEEEHDVTNAKDGYFTAIDQLDGLQAKRPIGAGSMITQQHTEKIPVVLRGAAVALTLVSGRMQISTSGKVLQNGGIGDVVRIRNIDSGKVVQAKVLDENTVQVQ